MRVRHHEDARDDEKLGMKGEEMGKTGAKLFAIDRNCSSRKERSLQRVMIGSSSLLTWVRQ